ncbi:YolD-like family protein [Peribacillus deserti]|uniref:YolD-like family protein n=1 Tax=Peribacillus deserti TaxID=673318 RepID=A0A2N5M1N0_9BACI|nr:YolD-like family protein [Peribacillus deserti]PLT28252.1 YolD-like family protein [Peribacillus deserti]
MIRDRGRIKWTSMMLPEHVKLLRDWAHEDTYEEQAETDEQQMEQMNMVIGEAMEQGKDVTITYYANHRHNLLIGSIHYYNDWEKKLHVVDRFSDPHYLRLAEIVDVQFADE